MGELDVEIMSTLFGGKEMAAAAGTGMGRRRLLRGASARAATAG